MCLSIPAKVLSISGTSAKADVDGNIVEVNIMILDDVKIGDYVLVHAGFAIQKYEEDEALETLEMFKSLAEGHNNDAE